MAFDMGSYTHGVLKMGFSKILFIGLFLVSSVLGGDQVSKRKETKPCSFTAIYNFGDSGSDTGATTAVFGSFPPPYGETFFHKPAGRASDGRLVIDFIAELLGLPYLDAYLNSLATNYRHGANFAVGGATIRRQNSSIVSRFGISPFSLDIEITQFDNFKSRTYDLYKQANTLERRGLPVPTEFSEALYRIDIGNNDLYVGSQTLSLQQLREELPDMVNQLASAVEHLYQQGGRAFWIQSGSPLGCSPVNKILNPNIPPGFLDKNGCVKGINDVVTEYNRQLKDRLIKLRAELQEAAITYVDQYSPVYPLVTNAKNEGFPNANIICCGYFENNARVPCGAKAIINGSEVYGASCANPSLHLSWDGVHATEAANKWVANHVLNGSASDPPIPITQACHRYN
ncbi:GDSL esterase/lipase [Quillaja saponaria]|uniref:GDSL esterase/lipase n=1 Tax=Quillaja saponaria TaxID=32244 RepID=A0AAD7M686_QUISA|nr:GDSL esterase/lipase [Quillaja saponaria]